MLLFNINSNKYVNLALAVVTMATNKTFAERLTELREKTEKKRQEVADDIGISRASLEYYEKGKRKPDIDVLLKLADYYEVTCDYLLKGVKTENVSINNVTGLSDKAIEKLQNIVKQSTGSYISKNHKLKIDELEKFINSISEEELEERKKEFNNMLLERKNSLDNSLPEVSYYESFEEWVFGFQKFEIELEQTENKKEAEIVLEALNYIIEKDNFFEFMIMLYVYLFADVDTSKGTLTGVASRCLNDEKGFFTINFDKELLNESYLYRINSYLKDWKDRGKIKIFDLEMMKQEEEEYGND